MAEEEVKKVRLGDLLVKEGCITKGQLDEALMAQKILKEYLPIGEVCVQLNFISREEFKKFLRKQQRHIYFGELLVNMGVISAEKMEKALVIHRAEKKKIGKVLLEHGFINEAQMVDVLSIQLGIPKIIPDLNLIDKRLFKGLNAAFLLKTEAMPAFKEGDVLTVIMSDPLDKETLHALTSFFGCKIEPAIAAADDIKNAVNLYYRKLEFGPEAASVVSPDAEMKDLIIGDVDLSKSSGDSIIEILNFIISRAIIEGASDIHIEPLERTLRVRYRIDGILIHKTDLPASIAAPLVSRVKILCSLDIAERRRHQDGRIEARVLGKEVDLRVSTYASIWGENVVIRILLRKSTLVDLEKIGFSPVNLKRIRRILEYPSGIMLVTGPTGSGKTTTLYASLCYLNRMDKVIITVEDPVEYIIDGVVQGKLDPKLELNYMDFLKAMMRQDPDVLMIGEIRDQAAAEAAIQAALTGHQVFSTFHTDDTTGALLRLMDMGIDTFLISSTVVSVSSQRLARSLCPACKVPVKPGKEILSSYAIHSVDTKKYTFFGPKGCTECNNTGYKGRTAIHELLIVNDDIREGILARRPSGQIRMVARNKANLISMREDGFYKATLGITSLEEVVRVVFYNESDELTPRSADDVVAMCEGKFETVAKIEPKGHNYSRQITRAKDESLQTTATQAAGKPDAAEASPGVLEGEFYRVRFDVRGIDDETAHINRLFDEYRVLLKKTGRFLGREMSVAFKKFIVQSATRLNVEKGAEFVEFSLRITDNKARIFMEALLADNDTADTLNARKTAGAQGVAGPDKPESGREGSGAGKHKDSEGDIWL